MNYIRNEHLSTSVKVLVISLLVAIGAKSEMAFAGRICIDFPDSVGPRITAAVCNTYGYSGTLEDGSPNPETCNQFTKRMGARYFFEVTKAYEANKDAEAARLATSAKVDAEISVS